jgi:hypothetical protein
MSACKSTCQPRNSVGDFFSQSQFGRAALPRGFGRQAGRLYHCWSFFNTKLSTLNHRVRQSGVKEAQLSTAAGQSKIGLESNVAQSEGQAMKRQTTTVNNRIKTAIRFGLSCLCLFFISSYSKADTTTQTTNDFVVFFKQAISSPPDIEQFVGAEKILHEISLPANVGPVQNVVINYVGARAGSNYFLKSFPGTNKLRLSITGRSGNETYTFNANTLTHTFDPERSNQTNYTAATGRIVYNYVCQFLNMGLSDIRPDSVVWSGNEFKATTDEGVPIHGTLETSNGLPSKLSLNYQNTVAVYRMISYAYSNSPTALDGFPLHILIWMKNSNGWIPDFELDLLSVKLATNQLTEEYFSSQQFASPSIRHENIESNGIPYILAIKQTSIKSNGIAFGIETTTNMVKMIPRPTNPIKVLASTTRLNRKVIIVWLIIGTIIPLLYYLFSRKTNIKQ